jgi:putative acetyltransferase
MNNSIVIRELRREDNPQLAKIIRSVLAEFKANKPGTVYYDPTTDDLFTLFQVTGAVYYVVEIDGELAGGSGVYPTDALPNGYCELVKLYLTSQTRGKGIGKALIEKCVEAAKSFGYTHMYLETMPELRNAIGLYEKLGFTYLPGALGQSGHFGCDLWMVKELNQ